MLALSGAGLAVISFIYLIVAALARSKIPGGLCHPLDPAVGVSVLKPLHGSTPATRHCLASFLEQTHPHYQVVFGVADERDAAVEIVRELRREFPHRDITLVINGRQHGANRKVSNLINMIAHTRHELLVISDSDVVVPENYVSTVAAPLLRSDVGVVTCAYRGISLDDVWSRLAAMFINEWFLPSVCVVAMFGSRCFAFGATIAIRRTVLQRIGGFEALVNEIADDYKLGEWTRLKGLRTELSPLLVSVVVDDNSFKKMVFRELRWLRTIRVLRPAGYFFSLVTFGPLVTLAGMLAVGNTLWLGISMTLAIGLRIKIHSLAKDGLWRARDLLLLPVRDFLHLGLWAFGLIGRRVHWGGYQFSLHRDGSLTMLSASARSLPVSEATVVNE